MRRIRVTPRSHGYGDVTVTYIRRSKNPHIYTLSISTCKNQSSKICDILYIPTYEYNYKVIARYDTILQEYYIIDRCNCENTKRYTSMYSTKGVTSYRRKTQETSRGPGRIGLWTVCRWSTLPMRISDQQPGESTSFNLRDLDMKGVRNSPTSDKMSAKWRAETSMKIHLEGGWTGVWLI